MGRQSATDNSWQRSVQIVSVRHNQVYVIRFLSELRGMMTHFIGRTFPCPGEIDCPKNRHKEKPIWKGYCAAERFSPIDKLWYPCVFEATEGLEERLRGTGLRGQVWSLSKVYNKKKPMPVEGIFLEETPEEELRPSFDIELVFQRLYRGEKWVLDVPNPNPPKLVLTPRASAIPKVLQQVEEKREREEPANEESFKEFHGRLGELFRTGGSLPNGKH